MPHDDEPRLTVGALRAVAASIAVTPTLGHPGLDDAVGDIAALPSDPHAEAVSACWIALVDRLRIVSLEHLAAMFDALSSDESPDAQAALDCFSRDVLEQRIMAEVTGGAS